MAFSIGADPEVFVRKAGKAIGVVETNLPGSKSSPHKTSRGAVQQDGMAAEFNIDPTDQGDFEGFNLNIVKTVQELKDLMPGCSLAKTTVQDFDKEYLDGMPDESKVLGCDPDYDAYTAKPNPRPNGELLFRSGAGHIHIGWGADIPIDNEEHIEICCGFIKMLDATVGAFMSYIDREPRRRELYGKAGAFRPKTYGVEYRTPSNAWIWNRDRRFVMHQLINVAIARHSMGYTPAQVAGLKTEAEVIAMVNEGQFRNGEDVVKRLLGYSAGRTAFDRIVADMNK